jgi:membrane-associated phospholipid phosphatase
VDAATRLHELDEAAFVRVAEWHAPVLDATMPGLTRVASYSVLWITISGFLAASGPRGRRAAVVGLGAVAVTSATANLVMKGLTDRTRPTVQVPAARRLPQPGSSSFPSGHTASAAAFSGVVGHEVPGLRLPLDALAAATGFSRVYTGAHYPGDVLAGWALGRAVAVAARRLASRVAPRPLA